MGGSDTSGEAEVPESSTTGAEGSGKAPDLDPEEVARLEEENARLRSELEAERLREEKRSRQSRHRVRRVLTGTLVILTSLSVVAATLGVWAQRTLADSDRYLALVVPLARDPAVTNALADRLTDEVFVALDVQGRIQDALAAIPNLPPAAAFIAAPIAAGARNIVRDQVRTFLASDAFVELWTELNLRAHDKIQALLNGDYEELPNVQINGGEVQLNLVSVAATIIQRIAQSGANALGIDATVPTIPPSLASSAAIQQLGSALGVTLPPDFGQVTIMTVDQLNEYQDAVRTVKQLVAALFLLSLLLIAATILVSPDRRRAVIWLGAGITIALFVGAVFLRRVRANIVDSLDGQGAKAAAQDVFGAVGASLRRAGLLVLVIGLLAALVAYIAGRPPWIQNAGAWRRRVTARRPEGSELDVWVAAHAPEVRIGGVALGAIVLFFTGIDWIPVALVALLVGLLLWGVSGAERRVGAATSEGEASPA